MISKADAVRAIQERDAVELAELEMVIDNALKGSRFVPNVPFTISTKYPSPRVAAKLKALYESGGWTLTIKDDQRDGTWIELL